MFKMTTNWVQGLELWDPFHLLPAGSRITTSSWSQGCFPPWWLICKLFHLQKPQGEATFKLYRYNIMTTSATCPHRRRQLCYPILQTKHNKTWALTAAAVGSNNDRICGTDLETLKHSKSEGAKRLTDY